MKNLDKKVSLGMTQELYDIIKEMAEADARSMPNFIRQILWEYVKKQ